MASYMLLSLPGFGIFEFMDYWIYEPKGYFVPELDDAYS